MNGTYEGQKLIDGWSIRPLLGQTDHATTADSRHSRTCARNLRDYEWVMEATQVY